MGSNFIPYDRDRAFALPQNMRDWLPAKHLCWKVIKVVEELDLSTFLASYRADGQGRAAYHPAVLVALVVYCYSKGIRSSRGIEAACLDDVGCRIITANHRIDHATVARFLRRHRRSLKAVFVQVLALCARQGLVDLTAVTIDGSPMEANAARVSNRSVEHLEAAIVHGEAEITAVMGEALVWARAAEYAEDHQHQGHRLAETSPARLSRLSDRLVRARSAKDKLYQRALPSAGEIKIKVDAAERMVARAQQRLATVTAAQHARLEGHARRAQDDRAAGRRGAVGRPPVPLEAKTVVLRQRQRLERVRAWLERARHPRQVPSAAARASLTDPDSRLMLGKHGGYLQGYNLQIACARNQLLIAIELQDNPADMTALVPMVHRARRNCVAAGITATVQAWLADNGYASAANFDALAGMPLFVAVTKEEKQIGLRESAGEETVPLGQREMAARLDTPAGRSLYKRRSALVEPGFAQLFQRFGRFLNYRGTDGVDTEIKLLGAVHNLGKLFLHQVKSARLTA